ncbi:MAG: hypothetical protein H7X92_01975 [Chitinophagales bacterium]|nr:hypothetical protein [Hyphomicrobiales bacterium]
MPGKLSRRSTLALIASAGVYTFFNRSGWAAPAYSQEDLSKLTDEQRQQLFAYREARDIHDKKAGAYWSVVEAKRAGRKKKNAAKIAITADDYVCEHAPVYQGPPAPADVLAILAKPPKTPPKTIAVVADLLRNAQEKYGFAPLMLGDDEFKRRYAAEAVRLKFTKDQIVRVYSLETGGYGAFDMQAGYNPVTKKVKPISTALGYAQLLSANSVEVLGKYGPGFAARLEAMAALTQDVARSKHLRAKAKVVRAMGRDARGVGDSWPAHVKFGGTPKGQAMHAMNLDADVGPWMQIQKLDSTRDYAVNRGMPVLTGGELEMMNLAGPSRGFEMLTPIAKDASTSNFFDRGGYERNPVVHNKTAAQLLTRMNEIMDRNRAKDGARKFDAIFDGL